MEFLIPFSGEYKGIFKSIVQKVPSLPIPSPNISFNQQCLNFIDLKRRQFLVRKSILESNNLMKIDRIDTLNKISTVYKFSVKAFIYAENKFEYFSTLHLNRNSDII